MTVKRLFAIMFIFAMTTVAWMILGSSLTIRKSLMEPGRDKVAKLWGQPQVQTQPTIKVSRGGQTTPAQPASSKVDVGIKLDYRRVGLLWYPVYAVTFDGVYEVENPEDQAREYSVCFKAPATGANLDDFVFQAEGGSPSKTSEDDELRFNLAPGQVGKVRLHYLSRGMNNWTYGFGPELTEVRNFELTAHTDFRNIDFKTISPSEKRQTHDGWDLVWKYTNSRLSNASIVVEMPQRQHPGDLAGRISFFAPVSLLFFLTVMVVITVMKKMEIHPMNYFFLAAAFFGFHLLLAYLVDHIDVHAAFIISAVVSVFLVVSYLRLVTGARFALLYAGSAQLIFLIGFSYAFFFEGFAGLAVTIGALATLFVLMQVTGRVKWAEVLSEEKRRADDLPILPLEDGPPQVPRSRS